jgi:hypothetical protein
MATRKNWRAISAVIAVSRQDSFTGNVPVAVIGKPIRRAALKNSM